MILLPKYSELVADGPIEFGGERQGEYRLILYNESGKIERDTGWFSNLITNNGLNIIRSLSSPYARTYVGSGTTPPTNVDTAMETYMAQSNTVGAGSGVSIYAGSPNYEFSNTLSRRFAAGVATGTINEIGMGASTDDTGTNIYNRQIVSPAIVKGASQVLDVIFRQTFWPSLSTVNGTVSIGGVTYDTITRGATYTANINSIFNTVSEVSLSANDWLAYDGDISADVEGVPSGAQSGGTTAIVTAGYILDSHYMDMTASQGLTEWNPTLGIRSVRCKTNVRNFQTQFNAQSDGSRIPKDNTKIIDITWRYSWSRH